MGLIDAEIAGKQRELSQLHVPARNSKDSPVYWVDPWRGVAESGIFNLAHALICRP